MLKVLILDDELSAGKVLKLLIEKFIPVEKEIQVFQSSQEALEAMETFNPSLIMLDIEMPEMNGFDFLVAARANPAWRDMIILMVTTETEMSQMQRALEAGANEYVMKPFTKDVLREKLQLVGLATV